MVKKNWALSESEYNEGKAFVLEKLKILIGAVEFWWVFYGKELKIMFGKTKNLHHRIVYTG